MTVLVDESVVEVVEAGVSVIGLYLDLEVQSVDGGLVVDVAPVEGTVIEAPESRVTLVDVYGGPVGPPGPTAVSADDYNVARLGSDGLLYVQEGARMSLDLEVDESDSVTDGFVYVGEAVPGTDTSVAAWRIKRISDTGTTTSIEWAEGNAESTQVWDDRKSLVYGP